MDTSGNLESLLQLMSEGVFALWQWWGERAGSPRVRCETVPSSPVITPPAGHSVGQCGSLPTCPHCYGTNPTTLFHSEGWWQSCGLSQQGRPLDLRAVQVSAQADFLPSQWCVPWTIFGIQNKTIWWDKLLTGALLPSHSCWWVELP